MALGLLAEIMGWNSDDGAVATREYGWLRLMSAVKYDGYSDFRAGARFLESLATWLKQFKSQDRAAAYEFVKTRLVYVSLPELHRLIEAFIPEVVTPAIRAVAAAELRIKPYEIWRTAEGSEAFKRNLRKTLFVGMSDGSRIDILRRANARRLSQEQVLPMMNIDDAKWRDLAKDLRKAQGDDAKFERIFLIDDFTASGTTFIRNVDGEWKGKLERFNRLILSARDHLLEYFPIIENYNLNIHHYISSDQARVNLDERLSDAFASWDDKSFGSYTITESLRLPASVKLSQAQDGPILGLCDTYYDHALYLRLEKHCKEAKQDTMKFGYADCALPVVLDHNTPNNSISLLWAETVGEKGAHVMRPLFFRRDRHG
ncbi:hypothetical protein AS593_06045 [Caulobacter vibrioides]|nr:hypothetical protein AS593_06045 [Caulobacter vibrioides]